MTTNNAPIILPLRVGMLFVSETPSALELIQRLSDPSEYIERKKQLPPIVADVLAQVLTTQMGGQFAFRFDERCGCSRCPCSPGFEILAEDTELARAVVEEPDRYARLVFWAEMLPGGQWKIEGRYRNETFFKGLVLPLAAVALPVPSPTATTSELKN